MSSSNSVYVQLLIVDDLLPSVPSSSLKLPRTSDSCLCTNRGGGGLCLPEIVQGVVDVCHMAVWIFISKLRHRCCNCFIRECACSCLEITRTERFSPPSRLHGVQVSRCLIIAPVRKSSDVEGSHHVVILVDQVVAMEHVDSVPWSIVSLHDRGLSSPQPDHVLEPSGLVGHDSPVAIRPREDTEVNQMNMDGMRPAIAGVLQLPDLGCASWHLGENPIVDIGKDDVINLPLAV
ncbi:hypothetical protein FJTKL_08640 [Diaporthe vaccinii]|uniref:Uncharacterized protein n=1 Tax=Diaporthe vaccinii TaxID=105482 RepID=A0ABR4EQT9_9PEZI